MNQMTKFLIGGVALATLISGLFLFLNGGTSVTLSLNDNTAKVAGLADATSTATFTATSTTNTKGTQNTQNIAKYADIENQTLLPNPPQIIKAIYSTGWSAGSSSKLDYFINLIKTTELNAIVIDIKDYSGYVLYNIDNADVAKYGAKQIEITKINSVIKRLHDEGIYVIARVTVFQDPILAKARPEWAIHRSIANASSSAPAINFSSTASLWYDNKKLAWMDPSASGVWDYNIAIAKDAAARGFDEINFDYIRFASDGNLSAMRFPVYSAKTETKRAAIARFFKYLRDQLSGITISADLFGLSTVNYDDLGIGQRLEDAAPYFDALAPMVYPSHYAAGSFGYKNPANYPYEIIKTSMDGALKKLNALADGQTGGTASTSSATTTGMSATSSLPLATSPLVLAKLRPWLQDFNLGATYDVTKVKAEIQAVNDTVGKTGRFGGWMMWNSSNVYTKSALEVE